MTSRTEQRLRWGADRKEGLANRNVTAEIRPTLPSRLALQLAHKGGRQEQNRGTEADSI